MKRLFTFVLCLTLVLALVGCGQPAEEETFPTNNVSVICNYSAGGTTDAVARNLVANLDLPKGITATVENVAGSSGLVGMNQFALSKADGYTLGTLNVDFVLNMAIGYTEWTMDDFEPFCIMSADPYVIMAAANGKFQTFEEMIDYAKEHPGKITVADAGVTSATYLVTAAIEKFLDVDLAPVTYDSTGEGVTAVLAGECDLVIGGSPAAAGQLSAGNIIALAVSSKERSALFPDVPGYGELYSELEDAGIICWIGMSGLVGTPENAIEFWKNNCYNATQKDSYNKTLANLYSQANDYEGEEVLEFIMKQYNSYKKITEGMTF